jgi:hypothetical protein
VRQLAHDDLLAAARPGLDDLLDFEADLAEVDVEVLGTFAATPEPSFTSPNRMCSVPMYSWLKRCASWFASCITLRARSVKRSYMQGHSD